MWVERVRNGKETTPFIHTNTININENCPRRLLKQSATYQPGVLSRKNTWNTWNKQRHFALISVRGHSTICWHFDYIIIYEINSTNCTNCTSNVKSIFDLNHKTFNSVWTAHFHLVFASFFFFTSNSQVFSHCSSFKRIFFSLCQWLLCDANESMEQKERITIKR